MNIYVSTLTQQMDGVSDDAQLCEHLKDAKLLLHKIKLEGEKR